jgi:signal transduction histidine kinase
VNAPASLQHRLLLAGAVGVVLAALVAALLLGAVFERAAQRSLDQQIEEAFDQLIALAETAPTGQVQLQREPSEEHYDRVFSGWYWAMKADGAVRSSRSAWDAAGFEVALNAATAQRVYARLPGPRGQQLRIATQSVSFPGSSRPVAFAVAGDLAQVHADAREFRWFAGASVAMIALTLLAVLVLQVRFGLRPLQRIPATLARLNRGEAVRFEPGTLPAEVSPLAVQVNELLDEHERRIARARHAAGDLAHALKTPLTALALDCAGMPEELAQRVRQQVQRMQAAVNRQLGGALHADPRQRTAVRPVLESLLSLMRRAHAARVLQWHAELSDASFAGAREDLEDMLGNLLDNAGKWARSQVRIDVETDAEGWRIRVEDDGPGLSPEQVIQALQRGVRLDERAPGAGLGLSIVDELARSYGGELKLDRAALGGLRAELRFPPHQA